jgi:hypothetical protein
MVGAADDNLDYINILTHFVESACGPATDQVPLGTTGYSPLRSGYLGIRRADVVDVFGRKRRVIDPNRVSDAKKVVVSWQMRPPVDGGGQIYLPPRLARPARLRFDLLSAADDGVVTSPHPSTSPVRGWIVPNHLDNSLMLFSPIGQPLGSLGAFGAQTTVAWQPAPGRPAQTIDQDLAGDILAHLRKFADFIHGQPRAFFDDLMLAIAGAHTYILPADAQAAQALAVLIGQPLALVRAGLRLELAGLPAFETSLDQVRAALSANTGTAYDWTRRSEAGLAKVEFPVRLGDRDHLEDGLVGFLLDSADPYDTLYAPAAKTTGGTGITRPAPDTVRVRANANIDPPATPYSNPTEQISALLDVSVQPARTLVTLLMDPRASVHAAMGILPVKEISLPAEIYSRALRSIEVAFFTHPLLRGAQGVDPPVPDEAGYLWRWTMGVKQGGTVQPHNEPLLGYLIGDRAHFSFSPQLAQDGWLTLVPQPKDDQR